MKRDEKSIFGIKKIVLLFIMLFSILLLVNGRNNPYNNYVSAQEGMPSDILGVNPETIEKMPQTPEEAKDVASAYLKKEWQKMLANNKFIGPFHRWSMSHQEVYQIIFKENYDLSLKFLLTFILWIYFMLLFSDSVHISKNLFLNLVLGIFFSLVLAHINFIGFVVNLILKLWNLAAGNTWKTIVFWAGLFIILFLVYYLGNSFKAWRDERKKKAKEKEIEISSKEEKKFIEGLEEGREASKELRDVKKNISGYGEGI